MTACKPNDMMSSVRSMCNLPLIMLGLTEALDCPRSSAPHQVGDPPGPGVITIGVILPLNFQTADQQCGTPDPDGLAKLEGLVWVINNARQILAPTGLKIGVYKLGLPYLTL